MIKETVAIADVLSGKLLRLHRNSDDTANSNEAEDVPPSTDSLTIDSADQTATESGQAPTATESGQAPTATESMARPPNHKNHMSTIGCASIGIDGKTTEPQKPHEHYCNKSEVSCNTSHQFSPFQAFHQKESQLYF